MGAAVKVSFKVTLASAAITAFVGVVVLTGAWFAQEAYTSRSEFSGGA